MQDCFSRSYYRWFFLKSCKCSCFQREVSHTGSSRTAGAQIGEKRFALFDCVTQLWCFVAPSSHWKFWKKFVALIKLSLFWFEFNYHFPRQRPYPISTPMDRENYTHVFIICVGLLLGLPRGRSLWFEHHVYLSRCQLRIKKLADLHAVLKSIVEQCTSILKFQMW